MATKKKRQEDGGVELEEKVERKLTRPRLYKVLLHNDDYTSMEFVVALLIHVFHHNETDAQAIMLHVHRHGVGVAGVFTYEIAETKVAQVRELAENADFPLLCTMEPDESEE